jgi:hydrogenase nickel incorporation protein HypA/HybF
VHELSLVQSIVEACSEKAGSARVLRVTLEVGKLSCVMPEALTFCYEVCTRGTVLEGSELEIIPVPGRAVCRACGQRVELHHLLDACRCGSIVFDEQEGGDDLKIKSMEVA